MIGVNLNNFPAFGEGHMIAVEVATLPVEPQKITVRMVEATKDGNAHAPRPPPDGPETVRRCFRRTYIHRKEVRIMVAVGEQMELIIHCFGVEVYDRRTGQKESIAVLVSEPDAREAQRNGMSVDDFVKARCNSRDYDVFKVEEIGVKRAPVDLAKAWRKAINSKL